MAIDIDTILSATSSHAQTLGVFDSVTTHELVSAPTAGHCAAIWVDQLLPIPNRSGLATTSAMLVLMVRMYQGMNFKALDIIDPVLVKTADLLIGVYTGDFTFGLAVAEIDILGKYGNGMLGGRGGYLDIDGKMCRIFDLTVPLVLNDVWQQAP